MTRMRWLLLVRRAVVVAAVTMGAVTSGSSAAPAKTPILTGTLYVCPDSTWRSEGDVFQIGVCVSTEIADLMGYNVAVTFDSSVIEILAVTEGPLPQSAPGTTFFWWFHAGVKSDSVHVNGAILEGTVNGPGELFTMTFRARTHGVVRTTTVRIAYADLRNGANQPIDHERVNGFVAVEPPTGIVPSPLEDVRLECRPNPFGPSTTVMVRLPAAGGGVAQRPISVGIYAADGRRVTTLFDGIASLREFNLVWDGTNSDGEKVTSGVYFAAARTGDRSTRTKLVLIR